MEDRHIVLPAWHPDTAAGAAQTQSQAMEVDGGAAAATQPTPMTLLGVFDGHRWASCGGKVWAAEGETQTNTGQAHGYASMWALKQLMQ